MTAQVVVVDGQQRSPCGRLCSCAAPVTDATTPRASSVRAASLEFPWAPPQSARCASGRTQRVVGLRDDDSLSTTTRRARLSRRTRRCAAEVRRAPLGGPVGFSFRVLRRRTGAAAAAPPRISGVRRSGGRSLFIMSVPSTTARRAWLPSLARLAASSSSTTELQPQQPEGPPLLNIPRRQGPAER